ncbi:MAG: hypothetical protein F6J98_35485 [Moorea sp. SIO4G2]|nr:hypothetical protein [Moorena sp. SIO4G2]
MADHSFMAASQFQATATAHPTLLLPILPKLWWAVADHSFTAAGQFQATATAHPTIPPHLPI